MISKYFNTTILILLSLCIFPILHAQEQIKLSGKVIDATTGEALPFATVSFLGNEVVGTTTDFDGSFLLESKWGTDTLQASYLGYHSQLIVINKQKRQRQIIFKLDPNTANLETIVIEETKRRYKRKNNPAVQLIKKVMANKSKNRIQGHDFFEYDKYEKLELALNNITEKFKSKKLFKKVDFIFDFIDTSEVNGKTFLPIYIREIASKVYYRKKPTSEKEFRKGIKMSGVEEWFDDQSMSMVNDMLYQKVDIYDNDIFMFSQSFVSPLNNSTANLFYRYYIMDTLQYKNNEVIELAFMPANKGDLGFKGSLYILNDSSYAVVKANLSFAKQINLNWVNEFELIQEFEKQGDNWLLNKDHIITDFAISKKGMGIFGSRTVMYSNHIFGQEREGKRYTGSDKVVEENNVYNQDETFWDSVRQETLSAKEQNIYLMIDTLKSVPAFRSLMNLTTLLGSGYFEYANLDFGPVGSFYSFNQVEGFRLKFGIETTPKIFPRLKLGAFAAYGFKDQRWKYGGLLLYSFRRTFLQNPKHFISFNYQRETSFVGQKLVYANAGTLLLSFKRGDASKMLLMDAFEFNYLHEWQSDWSINLSAKVQKQSPLGTLEFKYSDPEKPEITESLDHINISEFNAVIRWAPNEKYVQSHNFRRPIFGKNPIFNLNYAKGFKGIANGDYNYHRLTFDAFKRFYLGPLGFTNFIVDGGKVWTNNTPYYLLLLPQANQTYSFKHRYFNMMNYLEFTSDHYLGWNIEHHFKGFFFNKVPLLKRLKFREVFTFKGIWGGLSSANDPRRHPELIQFIKDENNAIQTYTLENKPYMEISFGVANIFKIIRIDLLKRINYLDHPNLPTTFGIRGLGLRFKTGVQF